MYNFIIENNKLVLYKSDIKVDLSRYEEEKYIAFLCNEKITDYKDYNNKLYIYFGTNIRLEIDNNNLLTDNIDIKYLLSKINEFIENKNIEEFKKRSNVRKINRINKLKGKLIAISLSSILLIEALPILTGATIRNENNEVDNNTDIVKEEEYNYTYPKVADILAMVNEMKESNEVIDLYLESVDNSKKEETLNVFGDTIKKYASRYGFKDANDLIVSFITQERPALRSNGTCDNPCQLTGFAGASFNVDVYDDYGNVVGTDDFYVTNEMINDNETNIKIGIAYLRYCTDLTNSLVSGLFSYNQGPFALKLATDFYEVNIEDYKGDSNALKARDLIVRYFKLKNACKYYNLNMDSYKHNISLEQDLINKYYSSNYKSHGDYEYLENVFKRCSDTNYKYYMEDGIKEFSINNLNNTIKLS